MKTFAFLLQPSFQLLGLVSAIEALRVANSVCETPFYAWEFVHDDEASVMSSAGVSLPAARHISELEEFDVLIVTASFRHQDHVGAATAAALRRFARFGKTLGSFESGIYHLAQAGVMDGHKATAHFNNLPLFEQLFPRVEFLRSLFTCGQGRMTASGGSACLDLMLHVIETDLGAVVATRVASLICHPGRRLQGAPQDGLLTARSLGHQPAVRGACRLMEERIGDTAGGIAAIAAQVGVSRRHLDRMFLAAFGCTASDYFRQIRLARARKLVKGSALEFGEISSRCGFGSYSHFLLRYRELFGVSPSQDRRAPNLSAHDPAEIRPSDDLHPFQAGLDLTRMI
ncbi:GlxA family transcriptional regulator [Pseudodonghicola flavimaris]|uniref:Helix-turn-helix domain-containing protein n=1 Tax=Pseudodonghicola flavimaris TaxID=3050036 RepID=A0ABT7F2G7_9RHOB|nr:helix-turn-helix domain-containing protein [Pseudodonghicola flavimaris]MDK3018806.1 helix-turn-helix domain-containing protein [Pseudodonghicola flavimaris]